MFGESKHFIEEIDKEVRFGWHPPFPDSRDYTINHPEVIKYDSVLGLGGDKELPESVNLSSGFPTIKDQGDLGSCTANAAAAIIEYFQNKAFETYIAPSRLFIYKTTRNLLGLKGDRGAYLRTTMASLVYFGAPPERFWDYKIKNFDIEPTSFTYGIADNYEALTYFCHDPLVENKKYEDVLESVKVYISVGIPAMFGFYVFDSMSKAKDESNNKSLTMIPFPAKNDKCVGGHAVVAVGYDDNLVIKRFRETEEGKTVGAFLIKNSWGKDWGYKGLGWLPYEYVLKGYACDFWSILNMKWVETGKFGF